MKSERVGMIFLACKISLNDVGLPICTDGMYAKNLKSERTKKTDATTRAIIHAASVSLIRGGEVARQPGTGVAAVRGRTVMLEISTATVVKPSTVSAR